MNREDGLRKRVLLSIFLLFLLVQSKHFLPPQEKRKEKQMFSFEDIFERKKKTFVSGWEGKRCGDVSF